MKFIYKLRAKIKILKVFLYKINISSYLIKLLNKSIIEEENKFELIQYLKKTKNQ